MKINLLIPRSLSLSHCFSHGFEKLGCQVKILDYEHSIRRTLVRVNSQIFRFPFVIKNRWYGYYYSKIRDAYQKMIDDNPADLFLVYNSQMLTPEILSYIKSKGSKVVFFMGDSPYYTKTNIYYINLLFQADHIFAPDTYWIQQLHMLGIRNADFLVPGFNPEVFKSVNPTLEHLEKYKTNCVFMGINYDSSIGFKRSYFLTKFAEYGLTIYGGRSWYRWIERFPELKNAFVFKDKFISDQDWNLICNCAKIHPIDANPGFTNGIHIRVFDSIGSGVLPIVEYRSDLDFVFPNEMLPTIKSYDDIPSITSLYLNDDKLRKSKIDELRAHISSNFSNVQACKKILSVVSADREL